MQRDKLLLMIWFSGITGFFFVFVTIFISMIPGENHKQVILYEPSNIVFWIELMIMLFVLYLTLWILHNYLSGRGILQIVKNNPAKK